MYSNFTRIAVCLAPFIFVHCQNADFVNESLLLANGTFGVEVFVTGTLTNPAGALLSSSDSSQALQCAGIAGIDKANCICEAKKGWRRGTFRAWISIAGVVDAICNIQGRARQDCSLPDDLGPFYGRTQDATDEFRIYAENSRELASTGFRMPLGSVPAMIATGTNAQGRATGQDCSGFTLTDPVAFTAGDRTLGGFGFTEGITGNSCQGASVTMLCMRQSR